MKIDSPYNLEIVVVKPIVDSNRVVRAARVIFEIDPCEAKGRLSRNGGCDGEQGIFIISILTAVNGISVISLGRGQECVTAQDRIFRRATREKFQFES